MTRDLCLSFNISASALHVVGMEGSRSQGQVTSSSEIGLGSPLGQPGQQSNKELAQGDRSAFVELKGVTSVIFKQIFYFLLLCKFSWKPQIDPLIADIADGHPNNPSLKCNLCAQRLEDTHFVQVRRKR